MSRQASLFITAAIAAAIVTGVHFDYLFGPDEPREAEISRETLADGRWVTPHLCSLPFLEKPPLYYNTVALAFRVTGRITPTVARAVSVFYSVIMLAAAFMFAYRWKGARAAWFSVLVLLTMPRFWRYSHTVLLDIAMGAFCTCALVSFAWAALWAGTGRRRLAWMCLCAIFSAAAFLTKGVLAIFNIVVVAGGFCLLEKRWRDLKRAFSPIPLLIFAIPIGAWIILFYREGGAPYLHEHFVNNIVGRFLQIHFEYPGVKFQHTDIGYALPWHFYLSTLPEILGIWVAALPFAIWHAVKRMPGRGMKHEPAASFALVWAVFPAVLLSFSAVKERTYILPSYAAAAILVGWWLDEALSRLEPENRRGVGWLALVFPCALFSIIASLIEARPFLIAAALCLSPALIALAVLLTKKRFAECTWLVFALLLCVTIVSFSPNVLYAMFKERCFLDFSRDLWRIVGDGEIYLYRPNDNARGSVPFYGNRTTPEMDEPHELRSLLRERPWAYVVVRECVFEELSGDPTISGRLRVIPMPQYDSDPRFLLARVMEGIHR